METSVTRQFVLLALHPEKGRVLIPTTHFRYALTGAVLMDFVLNGEITLENKKLIPSFRKNGERIHDMFAEKIEVQSRPKRIAYWIRRFSMKSHLIFKEAVNYLTASGILMHEKRYFLNFIPYNRYILADKRIRRDIIDGLREVLLRGRESTGLQSMLIGLLKASGSHSLLAKEKSERSVLRKKCRNYKTDDEMASETERAIKEVQTAIIASVTAATVAAHARH
jgi:hypothetical protein